MDHHDEEFLRRVDGLFVGQLSASEVAVFNRLCRQGLARRVYEGASGLLGLATCRQVVMLLRVPE